MWLALGAMDVPYTLHVCDTLGTVRLTKRGLHTMTTSTEIDYSQFGAAAGAFQAMIPNLINVARDHDDLVAQLSIKEGEVNEDVLETARLRNKANDAKVTKLNEAIKKLQDTLDEQKAKAWELIQDDIPKPLTDDEKAAVRPRIKDLREQFKKMTAAVEVVADSLSVSLDGVTLPTINANARTTGGGTRVGHSGPRIHMDAVFVNGEHVTQPKANKPDETASTLTTAANFITAKVKASPRISASDLQVDYFKAAKVTPDESGNVDVSKIPLEVEFTYVYTNPNDQTKSEFAVKAKRRA